MKVHKYVRYVTDEESDAVHGALRRQTCLYIPYQGIIGFRKNNWIEFYSEEKEIIEEAQEAIKKPEFYRGEIDLPQDRIIRLVIAGREMNKKRKEFQEIGRQLTDLIKD